MKTKTLIITIAALMLDAASATAATIATSAINNPLCQSLTVHVFFTANGRFDTDNVFTVQLSDMAGTFDNPVNIGSLNGTTSGVIPSVVPAGTPAGTGYRIRVISSLPLVIGSDNGSDLVIKMCNSIQTGAVRGSPFCQGSTVNVPFTADGIFNAGNVFTAQFSDAMGVFDNPVDIGTLAGTGSGTITAVIPYASPPGSAYHIRVVSSDPPVTGSNNVNKLSVRVCSEWTGITSNNWFEPLNWSSRKIPTSLTDVFISDVSPNPMPSIEVNQGTPAFARNLIISANARLAVSSTGAPLNISGNITAFGSLNGDGIINITGTTIIYGQLVFGGVINVKQNAKLFTNNSLTLLTGASLMHGNGTADGGGWVSGSISVLRTGHAEPRKYNYWSSPVQNENVSAVSSRVFYYNPDNASDQTVAGLMAGWVSAGGKMYTGVGYVSQGAGTVTFSGFPNDGTVKVIITKNAATGVAWNLVGNPYPSAVNALEFVRQNAALITGSLYFWDDDGSGGSGWTSQDYAVWNAAGTVAGPNTELQFDGHIASGQSFFVEKIDEGTSILNFSNTMRSTKNNAFFRTAPIERLWMSVVGPANDYNETLIAFMDEATHGYDRMYDAKKLYGNAGIALYTKDMKHRYAIQSLAPLTDDKSIVMGLDAGAAGNYTLEVKKIDALDESVTIILEDTETGHTQNLRADDTYTFYADAGTHDSRFILRFSPALQIGVSDATCFGDDGTITVRQAGIQPWSLSLIDENDFIIDRVAGFNGTKIFSGLTPGQYLLVLRDEYGYRLEKNIEVKGATPVKADFEASTSSVKEGEEISFSNLSEGAASYEWDFGDGSPLLLAEQASHIYTAHGIYEVKLTAHNSDCSALKTVLVAVSGKVTDIAPVENNGFYAYTDGQSLNVVFRFDKAEPAQLSIYDVAGKQLASENVLTAGTKNLPIEHGSSYLLLQLITEKNAYAQKILVMSR